MMRVAPDDPEKANGFLQSRFLKQVLRQAGGPFTSSIVQLSQNLKVFVALEQQLGQIATASGPALNTP